MKPTRSKLAIAALAGMLLAGGPQAAAASARVSAHAHRAAATGSVAPARTRELARVNSRLQVLQERSTRLRAGDESAIAARMQIVLRLREHLAQVQQAPCSTEAACQRVTALVPRIEANIAFNEGLAKHREEALERALARIALTEHALQARVAQL